MRAFLLGSVAAPTPEKAALQAPVNEAALAAAHAFWPCHRQDCSEPVGGARHDPPTPSAPA
eukprot:5313827-Prymnesium_polylepis.3